MAPGVGSFGRVYKGRRKYTGQFVAMKVRADRGAQQAARSACRSRSTARATLALLAADCVMTCLPQFIAKKGKSEKDLFNLRSEIEVRAVAGTRGWGGRAVATHAKRVRSHALFLSIADLTWAQP